jgi:hypothetical protein
MGATWQGQRIGAIGDLVSISFHANKNLTTAEGGCLVLNDMEEARRCELWRLQGVERLADGGLDVTLAGGKYNMTDIAARIGLGQLAQLAEFGARRQALARHYFRCFDRALGCELPLEDFANSNWHMFQIVLPPGIERGAFIQQMHAAGIGIGVHYPAIHLLTLYRQMGFKPGDFPIAEHVGARHRDAAVVPGDARAGRGAGMRTERTHAAGVVDRRACGEPVRPLAARSMVPATPELSVVIPVYNEEEVLPALFARLYPALDALGRATRSCSSTMAAATARRPC